MTADPADENTVYVMNLSVLKSIDGGATFNDVDSQHGDTHILWIDPRDPRRMILGDDGGASVSFDGGATWSSQHNQPTAQFYHVTTDDQFPYRLYGAQQDNSAISIASRSDDGGIGIREHRDVAKSVIETPPQSANDYDEGGITFECIVERHLKVGFILVALKADHSRLVLCDAAEIRPLN